MHHKIQPRSNYQVVGTPQYYLVHRGIPISKKRKRNLETIELWWFSRILPRGFFPRTSFQLEWIAIEVGRWWDWDIVKLWAGGTSANGSRGDVESAKNEWKMVAWQQEKEFRLGSVYYRIVEAKLAYTGRYILRVFSHPPIPGFSDWRRALAICKQILPALQVERLPSWLRPT